ncbi:MAG: hypothetical protein KatS3mg105_2346 [Gemmatales bacterium]|nr:MAG: hypothetical protein KatS3mg105_2346 [Gemmatales bacterium]
MSMSRSGGRGLNRHRKMPNQYKANIGNASSCMLMASIDGGKHGSENFDDKERQPPLPDHAADRHDSQAFDEHHDKRNLKGDAEYQGHKDGKTEPLVESQIGFQADPFVEPQKRFDRSRNNDKLGHRHAAKKQHQADGQIDVDQTFFMRIETGGDKQPQLPENPRTAKHDPRSRCTP